MKRGKINFVEGVRWTEGEVGTNAIGTALKTGEAVMIQGTEHYSIASHKWSCSAMPIFNEDRMLMGVLDIRLNIFIHLCLVWLPLWRIR